ncbi:hypothetical protein BK138_09040 [Paenibacillus rhizosphaerae]|uniref:Uncharacterized protein n=1 Tax=Paenibacillus rhizosphaerae TaxID=297318 RepID=A0A1R1F3J2_9BACL|nr:hypothetical protein BK138_09040 [Paenibacillus rhizosphaerae]OXL82652.1 hypothetical protein BCV73_05810 [Paenibacillus sp. SSG-1]
MLLQCCFVLAAPVRFLTHYIEKTACGRAIIPTFFPPKNQKSRTPKAHASHCIPSLSVQLFPVTAFQLH